jgi:hypothetical protein
MKRIIISTLTPPALLALVALPHLYPEPAKVVAAMLITLLLVAGGLGAHALYRDLDLFK